MDIYYIVETNKPFEKACSDLESEVKAGGFGILHIHDVKETLKNKGVDFKENCKIFEVCNPNEANKVLSIDMRLNMVLPCRISVFSENGKTKIGLIKPSLMLEALSDNKELQKSAQEVEKKIIKMVDMAK